FLVAVAMIVGIGGGAGSILFRELFAFVHQLMRVEIPGLIARPLLPLIPALGGLAAGLLAAFCAREVRGAGVSEVIDSLVTRRGVIRARVMWAKALASGLTLGTGGSAGAEGPIIQMGAALGSSVGQRFKFSETNLKTMIACGSAAGISAIFNAPIAGVLFALEVILGDFTIAAFTPVVISSVLSAVVAQAYWGDSAVFAVPDYRFASIPELGWYLILAALAGIVGVAFIKALYATDDVFERRLSQLPVWITPAIGGGLVGLVGLAFPEAMGVGYDTIGKALRGDLVFGPLLLLLVLKFVTTSLTIGSGGSGGFFAPSLFMGAALGGSFGHLAQTWLPGVVSPPGAFALVGMGALVAATTHAPLTAMLIIFEITGSYHIMLPLMFSTILAVIVARALEFESIYSLKLARQGIRLHHGRDLSVLERIPVSQIMRTDFDFVREHTPLGEMVGLIQYGSLHDFPVIDHDGKFLGMIWFYDIREVMLENDMYALLIAEDVLGDPPPKLLPRSSLAEVLVQFSTNEADALPVFRAPSEDRLAGLITRADLMRCYERELLLREQKSLAE
ncbi:MAG: chloride channel protein, partial [Candidatus Latescibacteria bacterium]|nr:chloride channel protein [Candidatus Latescibacterota bacterium]